MPDPAQDAADEEAEIQAMLLSLLTNRADEPVHESSPLDQARAAVTEDQMSRRGEPMYYTPASSYNFTDENVHGEYLNRLARDAEYRGVRKNPWGREPEFREAWHEGVLEEDRHPDWAFPTDTPPWWPERKLKELK